MEEKNRETLIKRVIYLVLAAVFLAFGITWDNRFCLGDVVLGALGLPAWSKGTQGFHYPAIPALIGPLVFFYLFAATTQDKSKTMAKLILGTIVASYLINALI